jgi:uncharacterized tellurite resistance protein B-like protein
LKEFKNNSLCHFSNTTTEHKCYLKEANNRNISCNSNSDLWSCKSGFRKSGEKCIKKITTQKIPLNSHKVGSSWTCNTNFYRNNSKTYCLKIPANSTSANNSNIFTCNSGYSKKGKGCFKNSATLSIPQNAHKDGDNWICDTNFYRNNAKTSCLAVPSNSYSRFYSNDFFCNAGYKKKGNQCDQIAKPLIIPMNAHEDGDNWTCDKDFYRNNAKTACLGVPANAFSRFYSNIFLCKDGYEKSGSKCIKKATALKIPSNAHKDGSTWVCNYNYYRNNPKTGCLKVPTNSTSLYDSNDFKCNTGYSKSGNKCVENIIIPQNSHKTGSSWTCNANYYRNSSKKACLKVPQNSYSAFNSNEFKCNKGYSKSGNKCVKKTTNNTDNNLCPGPYSASWTNCYGTYTYPNGDKYFGDFIRGSFNGKGKITFSNGDQHVGKYKDGKRSGFGIYTWPSGQKYVGEYKDGKEHGQGDLTLADGTVQKGIFKIGKFQSPTLSIPQNSHKTGSSWTCNANYFRNSSKKACLKVPQNSYSAFNSNEFKCNKGYRKSGNKCLENIIIPQNSHKVGSGWICDYNYYHNSSKTACIRVPVNSSSSSASNDFKCNTGYSKSGNKCVENIIIPQNSHKAGTGWICNANFYRNSSKKSCLRVPANSTSSSNSNDFKCNSDFNKNGDTCKKDYKAELFITGIIIFLIWLFNRKSKLKTPSDPKPKPNPKPIPAPQTKPKPNPKPIPAPQTKPKPNPKPIPAPQTKPKPKPKPKPRSSWRRIKDPRTLVIEIAVSVAMADGNLADIEGITINKWMKKKLDQDVNNEKIKKLFNDTLKEAHLLAESRQLNLQEICSKLNSKGTKELQLEALDLAYEVMGSDGHIHEKEAEMIDLLVRLLKISSTEIEEIRDQFMIKTLIINDFNILNLLGLPSSASKESKCRELKKEFKKWNGRLNILSTPLEKKNAQKVLGLLGIARKDIDC